MDGGGSLICRKSVGEAREGGKQGIRHGNSGNQVGSHVPRDPGRSQKRQRRAMAASLEAAAGVPVGNGICAVGAKPRVGPTIWVMAVPNPY